MHFPQSVFLFDIEGTTTAISFVTERLFPFASEKLNLYVRTHFESLDDIICAFRDQAVADIAAGRSDVVAVPEFGRDNIIHAVVQNAQAQIAGDRKITPLKTLQGMIWSAGYHSGELKGHVFEDVLPAFEHLKEMGTPIYIYSSGSVQAQQLLFGYSIVGDLSRYISGYFDTNIGHKGEANSYCRIAEEIGVKPSHICFLTDKVSEAEAAKSAGCRAIILNRPGNSETGAHPFEVLSNFSIFGDV